MKLKYKITILISLLLLLTTAANYLLISRTVHQVQIKRLESAEVILGRSLAHSIYRMLIEKDIDQITAILFHEKNLRSEKIAYLAVSDLNEHFVAHTFLSEMPKEIHVLPCHFEQDEHYRITKIATAHLSVYDITVPIREGILQVGSLHVGIRYSFISEFASPLQKASSLTLIIAGILALISLALVFATSAVITASLTRLEENAIRLSNGEFDVEVQVSSHDEIGRLGQAFEKMRTNIQAAHHKLEQQNINLETLIRERTSNLAESNRILAEQTEQLNSVLSAIAYPLYVINLDGSVAIMNSAAQALKGYWPLAWMDTHTQPDTNINPNVPNRLTSILKKVQETKATIMEEYTYTDKHDQPQSVEVHAFPIFDRYSNILQVVISCIDISDRKKDAEEKIQLERDLHRAQKLESIGTLAAGIAHEINTPIQFIGDNIRFTREAFTDLCAIVAQYRTLIENVTQDVMVETLKNTSDKILADTEFDFLAEELPAALQQTIDGVQHVSGIVAAMKDFSYMGTENVKTAEDINQAVRSTAIISKNEWKYVAELNLDLDESLPPVPCFIGELKQVLLNLVINSVHAITDKYSRGDSDNQKGLITIKTYLSEHDVHISVQDNGCGIPSELEGKIFDPFFTTKEVHKGTGQGLAISYQIIQIKHGGNIYFESQPGRGTTFFISLPLETDS
ncbi:ATP-binding protein [Desulfosediminicola flagellatus]|uniref:ATP-binding protein n=1 Tax=Desulfosediminicola flagellatus TaxID=2569541 RepID=UPI0010ABDD49|nr:ATP-binding protein [Desulfosediminicola flagellatus]